MAKAFTATHVLSLKTIKKKIRQELKEYYLKVQTKKGNQRKNRKTWRQENYLLFDMKKPNSDPDQFDVNEKCFYFDQKQNIRKIYLTEEIDNEFEGQRQAAQDQDAREESILELEASFIFSDNEDIENTPLNASINSVQLFQSLNRSGLARNTTSMINKSIQTDSALCEKSLIRKRRNCTEEVKTACANVSSACGISAEKAQIAV